MSDVLSILGNSECEVVSGPDIKDAYHSIRLTEKSKGYCGILPNFGSPICMSWSQFGRVCRHGVIFKKIRYWFSNTCFEASYGFQKQYPGA